MAESTPSFENNLERLEEIVHALEGGDLSLERSLQLFTEGTHLTRMLHSDLARAEKTVEELTRDPTGGLKLEPLPDQDLTS